MSLESSNELGKWGTSWHLFGARGQIHQSNAVSISINHATVYMRAVIYTWAPRYISASSNPCGLERPRNKIDLGRMRVLSRRHRQTDKIDRPVLRRTLDPRWTASAIGGSRLPGAIIVLAYLFATVAAWPSLNHGDAHARRCQIAAPPREWRSYPPSQGAPARRSPESYRSDNLWLILM